VPDIIRHKQGDTFDFSGVATDGDGDAFDFTGWAGLSQVRKTDGTLIEQLTFTWLDASTGLLQVKSVDDTQAWPVGKSFFDIQFTTAAGEVISTPTVTVEIIKDVSQ